VGAHVLQLVVRLKQDEQRNPNTYLSPIMVKDPLWQAFRANLKGFCQQWVRAAPTSALLQLASDEHLWAWFVGLHAADFFPLRHACTFVGIELLLAVAHDAQAASRDAAVACHRLAAADGTPRKTRRQEQTAAAAHEAGGAVAGGTAAGAGGVAGKALLARCASFADLVSAAQEWQARRERARQAGPGVLVDKCEGVGLTARARRGVDGLGRWVCQEALGADSRGKEAGHSDGYAEFEGAPRTSCQGAEPSEIAGGSMKHGHFEWLLRSWRARRNVIFRCRRREQAARAGGVEEGAGGVEEGAPDACAEVEALVAHVCESAASRCLIVCSAGAVLLWRSRVLAAAALDTDAATAEPLFTVHVVGATLPQAGGQSGERVSGSGSVADQGRSYRFDVGAAVPCHCDDWCGCGRGCSCGHALHVNTHTLAKRS
jgi:hypothetical protein